MKFEVQSVEDVQPEGTNNYFVVVGGDTGAPWEQKGFPTREAAESAKELLERVSAVYQKAEARLKKALEEMVDMVHEAVCRAGIPVEREINEQIMYAARQALSAVTSPVEPGALTHDELWKVIKDFGDATAGVLEQMILGNWVDDHDHDVKMNQRIYELGVMLDKATGMLRTKNGVPNLAGEAPK